MAHLLLLGGQERPLESLGHQVTHHLAQHNRAMAPGQGNGTTRQVICMEY